MSDNARRGKVGDTIDNILGSKISYFFLLYVSQKSSHILVTRGTIDNSEHFCLVREGDEIHWTLRLLNTTDTFRMLPDMQDIAGEAEMNS